MMLHYGMEHYSYAFTITERSKNTTCKGSKNSKNESSKNTTLEDSKKVSPVSSHYSLRLPGNYFVLRL